MCIHLVISMGTILKYLHSLDQGSEPSLIYIVHHILFFLLTHLLIFLYYSLFLFIYILTINIISANNISKYILDLYLLIFQIFIITRCF